MDFSLGPDQAPGVGSRSGSWSRLGQSPKFQSQSDSGFSSGSESFVLILVWFGSDSRCGFEFGSESVSGFVSRCGPRFGSRFKSRSKMGS